MRKTILFALGALLSMNAWSYDNVSATFKWTVGNESEATVVSDAAEGVKETKVKVGSGLTVSTANNLACNSGNTMVLYNPNTSKPGTVEDAMIEYTVKMKKGVTFTLTGLSYDAVKKGTNNAEYHWSYVVDDVESAKTLVDKDHLIRDNNTTNDPPLHHEEAISASAGQTVKVRFYVSGFDAGKNFCLSNIQIDGMVNGEVEQRAFTDFKIEFRTNPYRVLLPASGELPTGVSVSGTAYNGGQHGVQGGVITVPVDGPVKFTLGACQYSTTDIEIKKNGEHFATFSNNAACGEQAGHFDQNVTWLYNVEEAATLTFELGSQTYLPYFFAEACDFVPQVEVRYFDTDGKKLIGSEVIDGSSALVYKYGEADVTIAAGCAFRGWFDGNGPSALKVAEGTAVNEDLNLYAKATEIEVPEMGKIFSYDFRPKSFYPEDHEVLVLNGGSYNDAQHGWRFGNGNTLGVKVAGNALLVVGVCKYSHTGDTEVRDEANNVVGKLTTENNVTPDGELQSIQYTGEATTLTLHFTATDYIHSLKVYNIAELPKKDEFGYYEIAPNDGAGLILTLESMAEGEKIFLPNGIYDLGEACLTTISKNNISIIGQSMEGTIIKNTPDYHKEGISTTATFLITATNTYLQDLTLWNNMDYFASLAASGNGRAVCLQDKGTKTICKNVRMLSNQDTYYSNKVGGLKYFEDCEIHGTVDFICGDGSVYFKNNLLYCEKRKKDGGGSDALTANNGPATDKGYVFEGCTIKSECPTVSFGRAWNNQPTVAFLNTLVDYSAGEFGFEGSDIQRWTKKLMNPNAWPVFGEYNTHLADGTVLTPASNVVTFLDEKSNNATKDIETVLSADDAALRTIAYTLGDWAATAAADAKQAVCEKEASAFEPDGIYLVEADGVFAAIIRGGEFMDRFALYDGVTYTARKANARGGFGLPAGEKPEGVENTADESAKVTKIIRDGQIVIIKNDKTYNVYGMAL